MVQKPTYQSLEHVYKHVSFSFCILQRCLGIYLLDIIMKASSCEVGDVSVLADTLRILHKGEKVQCVSHDRLTRNLYKVKHDKTSTETVKIKVYVAL